MFRNEMPRFEILSEGALETVERGWRRLVSEIGIQFDHPRALDLFRAAGCEVEEARVRFDPDFLLEQAAKAPREFDMRARNPEYDLHIGGDSMIFAPTQGPPFVRDGRRPPRRHAGRPSAASSCSPSRSPSSTRPAAESASPTTRPSIPVTWR